MGIEFDQNTNDMLHESYAGMSEEAQKTGAFPVYKRTVSRRLVLKLRPTIHNDFDLNNRYSIIKSLASKIYKNILEKGIKCKYTKDGKDHSFIQFYLKRTRNEVFDNEEECPVGRITVSVHNDFMTITTVLGLKNCMHHDPLYGCPNLRPEKIKTPPILDVMKQGFSAFKEGRNEILKLVEASHDIDEKKIRNNNNINRAGELLFYKIWNVVNKQIFKGVIPKDKNLEVIADIRGAIFPRNDELALFYGAKSPNQTFKKSSLKNVSDKYLYPYSNTKYAKAGLSCLFPLFTPKDAYKYREFVGCTMFSKRALFISPVSTIQLSTDHAKLEEEQIKRTPICFALAPHYHNVWQLGRMLHRVNMIASYRALSICDVDRFRSASRQIKQINLDLHQARNEHFQKMNVKSDDLNPNSNANRGKSQKEISTYLNAINKIEDNLSRFQITIGKDTNSKNTVEMPLHTVEYDLYRSDLLGKRFRTQLEDLRLGRIEGWQPYDEYARRRIFPIQQYIERISARLTELRSMIDGSLRSSLAEIQKENSFEIVKANNSFIRSHEFQLIVETMAISYYGGYVLYSLLLVIAYYIPQKIGLGYWSYLEDQKAVYFCISITSTIALVRYFLKKGEH